VQFLCSLASNGNLTTAHNDTMLSLYVESSSLDFLPCTLINLYLFRQNALASGDFDLNLFENVDAQNIIDFIFLNSFLEAILMFSY